LSEFKHAPKPDAPLDTPLDTPLDAPHDTPDLDAPIPEYLHLCLSGCGSTFDTRDAVEGDIRFCGLGHAQRQHGNDWELIPVDTDHGGLHTRVAAYQ
jgi:hypothetical protein